MKNVQDMLDLFNRIDEVQIPIYATVYLQKLPPTDLTHIDASVLTSEIRELRQNQHRIHKDPMDKQLEQLKDEMREERKRDMQEIKEQLFGIQEILLLESNKEVTNSELQALKELDKRPAVNDNIINERKIIETKLQGPDTKQGKESNTATAMSRSYATAVKTTDPNDKKVKFIDEDGFSQVTRKRNGNGLVISTNRKSNIEAVTK